jgi:hypothetical protein
MNPINENKNNKTMINVNFGVTNRAMNESQEEIGSMSSSRDDNNDFRNGRWQPFEHLRFIKGCLLYGNNWKKVSLVIL